MKITTIKKVEDCFDGSSILNYWFDKPWDQPAIMELERLGTLEYFPDFPRPFFRVIAKSGLQIKGVEGEKKCRAIFPRKNKEKIKKEVDEIFNKIR